MSGHRHGYPAVHTADICVHCCDLGRSVYSMLLAAINQCSSGDDVNDTSASSVRAAAAAAVDPSRRPRASHLRDCTNVTGHFTPPRKIIIANICP